MILETITTPSTHTRISKNGVKHTCNSKRIVYKVQCDVCGKILHRSKGEAWKLETRSKHACSPECVGVLGGQTRALTHVPRSARRKSGYVYIGSRREHQIVMEESIGRSLLDGELVHHINGDKGDNRIDNLALCHDRKEHNRIHGQLEGLSLLLCQRGLIVFCKNCNLYFWHEDSCMLCNTDF